MRRKMFTAVSLFGISCTLMVLLVLSALYTYIFVSNPVEKNLSRTLYLNHIEIDRKYENFTASVGPYFFEKVVKPLSGVKTISIHALSFQPVTEYVKNGPIEIRYRETDENYWKIFSFDFVEGLPYNSGHIESSKPVAVITEKIRDRYFGHKNVIGETLILDNARYKVIGVVRNVSQILHTAFADVWIPYNKTDYLKELKAKYIKSKYNVLIIKKEGASEASIRKEFEKRLQQMDRPEYYVAVRAALKDPFQSLYYDYYWLQDDFYIKMGIALISIFIFLPLLNVTNLNTSRIIERYSEIALRRSFGATRKDIIVQFICESILVSIIGGIIAFIGAWLILMMINSSELLGYSNFKPDFRIFLNGLGIIFIFGALAGLYPAIRMSKLQIISAMRGGLK